VVIGDNATIHRSDDVKAFLANGWATKIHLENFPAYAPELNPDEGVLCWFSGNRNFGLLF
jgi:transposase